MIKPIQFVKGIAYCAIPFLFSCDTSIKEYVELGNESISNNRPTYLVEDITELTDNDYPDNPDVSIRSSLDGKFSHSSVQIKKNKENNFSISVLPGNDKSDTVIFDSIKLLEWIPSAPNWIKDDEYLTEIAIINQEWNRMQVNFKQDQFKVKGSNLESKTIARVDLARNCINAYLWELIFYTEENSKSKPCYHGWFNFPKELYASLFEEKNNLVYEQYRPKLEEWVDPLSKKIALNKLREPIEEYNVAITTYNENFYPLVGERKKKEINILVPKEHETINSFLFDSTTFATFSSPGFYNQKEPRRTELGRFSSVKKATVRNIHSLNNAKTNCFELEIHFTDGSRNTTLVVGGLNKGDIPILPITDVHRGYQMPMGIANHSFYTNYKNIVKKPHLESSYYGFLLDEHNNWLDSHTIGIDGPMLHFDNKNKNMLHVWLLSFERHCFVGHFSIDLSSTML